MKEQRRIRDPNWLIFCLIMPIVILTPLAVFTSYLWKYNIFILLGLGYGLICSLYLSIGLLVKDEIQILREVKE